MGNEGSCVGQARPSKNQSGAQRRRSCGAGGVLMSKLCLYLLFSVLAVVVNLGAQRVVLSVIGSGFGLWPALVAGTAAGLVLKYLLDKRWIFEDRSAGLRAQGQQFSRYTAMGAVTTLLFWAVEYGFWLVWGTEHMREIGAVLGLALGYGLKYWLDRRFVFTPQAGARA